MALLKEVERASLMATSDQLGSAMLMSVSKEAQHLFDFLLQLIEVDYHSYTNQTEASSITKESKAPFSLLSTVPLLQELYNLTLGCPPSPIAFRDRKEMCAHLRHNIFNPARELALPYAVVIARIWQCWSFLTPDHVYRGCLPHLKVSYSEEEIAQKLSWGHAMIPLLLSPMMERKRRKLYDALKAAWKDFVPNDDRDKVESRWPNLPNTDDEDKKKKQRTQKRNEQRARQRVREDLDYEQGLRRYDGPLADVIIIIYVVLMFASIGTYCTVAQILRWCTAESTFALSDYTAGTSFKWPV